MLSSASFQPRSWVMKGEKARGMMDRKFNKGKKVREIRGGQQEREVRK